MNNTAIATSNFITVPELADEMRVSTKTVYSWIYRGIIKKVKIGHTIRINKEHLKVFLEKGK
jgi:excisionase family DNA binding protein